MRKFKLAAYAMGALLTSCAVTGCGMTREREIREATTDSTYCNTAKPIYIAKSDAISDETARQILEHNLTGKALCGWGKK
jgi:nitrogen regulatory protein PII